MFSTTTCFLEKQNNLANQQSLVLSKNLDSVHFLESRSLLYVFQTWSGVVFTHAQHYPKNPEVF